MSCVNFLSQTIHFINSLPSGVYVTLDIVTKYDTHIARLVKIQIENLFIVKSARHSDDNKYLMYELI